MINTDPTPLIELSQAAWMYLAIIMVLIWGCVIGYYVLGGRA